MADFYFNLFKGLDKHCMHESLFIMTHISLCFSHSENQKGTYERSLFVSHYSALLFK